MKILVLAERYAPDVGGYEQACKNIVEGLIELGHEVVVLTATKQHDACAPGSLVVRSLEASTSRSLLVRILGYRARARTNQRVFGRVVADHAPDVVMVWKVWSLPDSILVAAERSGRPVVYYFHDRWFIEAGLRRERWAALWDRTPEQTTRRIVKRFVRGMGIKRMSEAFLGRWRNEGPSMPSPSHAIFVSESCRREYVEAGYPFHESLVIYNGIELRRFHPPEERGSGAPLRLLCIGRIEAAKGQHLVVDALAELRPHHPSAFHLDIVGPVGDADYRDQLVTTITSKGLSDCVSILDPVSCNDAPDCYRAHDVLVFPSVGPERFPLVILEAMASGLAVISTLTGGHREVLEHERNSLVVRSADATELARQLDRLVREPDLRARIAQAGMETVRPEYGLKAKRDEIAALLSEVCARTRPSNSN